MIAYILKKQHIKTELGYNALIGKALQNLVMRDIKKLDDKVKY